MPFDPLQRPDDDTINKERAYLLKLWQGAYASMETAYSFYLRQYPIWDAKKPREANRPTFRLGRATSIVDHAVDATLAFFPKIHRAPIGDDQKAASKVEKGLAAVLSDALLQNNYYAPKVNGKQLAIGNYTQLYVGLDSSALTRPVKKRGEGKADFDRRDWEWESNRHAWNPIRIEVPAPGEVLMNPLEKAPAIAIRNRKMLAFDLADLTKTKFAKRGVLKGMAYEITGDPYDEVEVTERWSAHWYALKRPGGEILFVEPNAWGFQPYIHTFGGTAVTPLLSQPQASAEAFDPKWYVEQALLFPVMHDIIMLDQMVTSQHNLLLTAAWARKGYRGDAAEGAKQMEGDIMQGDEADWWLEKMPQLPTQTFTHEGMLKADLEESTYSLLEAGFSQSNTDTATHIIVLSEKVHRKFQPAVGQLNHLYSIGLSNVLKLVHRLKEREGIDAIDMGEESLRASDIGGRFHISVDFGQVDTVTFLQQKQDARQELQAGIIDEETYLGIARYEDVAGIRKRRLKDEIRRMPTVHAMLQAGAMREEGFDELADQLAEAAKTGALEGEAVEAPLAPPSVQGNGRQL